MCAVKSHGVEQQWISKIKMWIAVLYSFCRNRQNGEYDMMSSTALHRCRIDLSKLLFLHDWGCDYLYKCWLLEAEVAGRPSVCYESSAIPGGDAHW